MNGAGRLACALAATALAGSAAAAEADPYAALGAMAGSWVATTSHGRRQTIDNHCARTGLFYVCEQAVGGKPAALVVFLPRPGEGRKLTFRVQTLTAAGDHPGPWRDLVIEGDHWTYGQAGDSHAKRRGVRTVDTFSGPDFMHVEVQVSADGDNWTATSSEDLTRAP